MVIGALILKNNNIIFRTESGFTSISPPDPTANCDDIITFNIQVTCPDDLRVLPSGNFEVLDLISNTVVASGTLVSGSATVTSGPLSGGNYNFVINYLGVNNSFSPSQSEPQLYNINQWLPVDVEITSHSSLDLVCFDNFSVSATVTFLRNPITDGVVSFSIKEVIGLSSDINLYHIGFANLNGSGVASITYTGNSPVQKLPSRLMPDYYLQARYLGNNCYHSGIDEVEVTPTNDTTTLTINPLTFDYASIATLTATVSSATLPSPSDGYVVFESTYVLGRDTINFILGTATPVAGSISLPILPTTYPSPSLIITIEGRYYSDNLCYDDSSIATQTIYT